MERKAGKPEKSVQPGSSTEVGRSAGRIDREIQTKIGQQLRAMYDDVVKEGVPERFAELLRRLEKRE